MRTLCLVLIVLAGTGCTTHTHITNYNGVAGIRGEPVEYQQTTTWALHAFFILPLIGNANVEHVVGKYTEEASKRGATRTNIELTNTLTYWFLLPPISFIIQPVYTVVEGQVEGTVGKPGS